MNNIKFHYQSNGWRPELPEGARVIDIGGANSYGHGKLDAIVDIREPQADAKHKFIGDIDQPEIWDEIMEHALSKGQWDFAICTHTLEDINNPVYVSRCIEMIAKQGVIVVPSKYRELSRFSDPEFRGYIHHRWIFSELNGVLTAYPKYSVIEKSCFDPAVQKLDGRDELVVQWEGSIGMQIVNKGMPFGTQTMSGDEHIKQLYLEMMNQ